MMAKKRALRVVAIAAGKGGVGKTTIASVLAVRAAQDGKVAMFDSDPQPSLFEWWQFRREPDNPRVIESEVSAEGLGLAMRDGYDWCFIDTPPSHLDLIEVIINNADFVLIPVRPSMLDLRAVGAVVAICKALGRPFAFVLNQVQPGKAADGAAVYLAEIGLVLDTRLRLLAAFRDAVAFGKTGAEVDKGAAIDVEALWAEVKAHCSKRGAPRHG